MMYKDADMRKRMGENGIKKARENYNWDKIGAEWVQLIETLIK